MFYDRPQPKTPLLPLDLVQGAIIAYAPRQLTKTFTSPLTRLRRQDNAETDIYPNTKKFLGSNSLVAAGGSLAGWVASMATTEVQNPTLYDQSGNAKNGTQPTASLQPYLLQNAFRGKHPAIFNKTSGNTLVRLTTLASSTIFGADKQFTFVIVVKSPVTSGTIGRLFIQYSTPIINGMGLTLNVTAGVQKVDFLYGNGVSEAVINAGDGVPGVTHFIAVSYDGTIDTAPQDRVKIYFNGQLKANSVTSAGVFPFDVPNPGNNGSIDIPATMAHCKLGDYLLYPRLLTTTEIGVLYKNQLAFYGK